MTDVDSPGQGRRLGLIVAGLVVVAVVTAAIFQSVRPVAPLDPQSPEGVVQAFLVAIDEERYAAAHGMLSAEARERCEQADLTTDEQSYSRVVVNDVTVLDDRTLITLGATVSQRDPLNSYSYETTLDFELIEEAGTLKIDQLPYSYYCWSL